MAFNINFSVGRKPLAIDKDRSGNIFYKMFSSMTNYLNKTTEREKVNLILQNPAALFVWTLQCDLASLGQFQVWKGDEIIENDPILDLLNKPNPMQTGKQFMWDYMFWNMIGQSNIYIDSNQIPNNKLYLLQNDKLELPTKLENLGSNIILSNQQIREIQDTIITYNQNGSNFKFKYKKLIQIADLSNGLYSWFDSPSRLDALYKIISNSELSLKSKNINTDFISKFFVAGKTNIEDPTQMPMSDNDKQSVRSSMFSNESVYPTKTMVDVKRFVDNYGVLDALDTAFLSDYYLVGKAFGIPRDVLEAHTSSTYENQEKARASHISYTIQPKMNDFCNALENYFGYREQGKEIICSYDHLPFVQVFEKDRADAKVSQARALKELVDSGVNAEDAVSFMEMDVRMDGVRNMNNQNNTNNGSNE